MTTPRIYVADLSAYNNGRLHGTWIDATQETDDIWAEISTMLKASPERFAEEHAIHDYEGFAGASISEYQSIETVQKIALFIEEHGELGASVLENFGGDMEEAQTALEESYNGEHKSLADFAEELTEETSEIPQHLQYYIDYEKMGRDWELSGDIFTIETGFEEVHIFWSR
jgi:antirestriction protein